MRKNRNYKNYESDYNWKVIQDYYDNNHTWKDVLNEYKIPNTALQKARKSGLFKTRTIGESLKVLSSLGKYDRSFLRASDYRKKISDTMTKLHAEGKHPGWYHINSRKDRRSYPEQIFLRYLKNTDIYNKYRIEEKLPIWKYFLDFAIIDLKLNIEIDGMQHYSTEDAINHDKKRNEYLRSNGWKIYRIKWNDFKNNAKKEMEELISYVSDIHNKSDRFYRLDNIVIKPKYFCKKCSKEVSKYSVLCNSCRGFNNRKAKRPSREELLELTRTMPMVKIGRMFGVSDNAVRKWIESYKYI
jgi:very-short-patch-repair endonuclease